MREMLRVAPGVSLGITPDGPTGPRRELAPGCIFLASKLRIPLVLMGVGFDRPWRYTRAWDHSAIPRPGSRARLIMSQRIHIPERLGKDGLETNRLYVQNQLNQLCQEAEDWASGQYDIEGSFPLYPEANYYTRNQFLALNGDSPKQTAENIKVYSQPDSRRAG